MANSKLSQLRRLAAAEIADNDIFYIVDVDDISSPTGEGKGTLAKSLSEYVINSSGIGISSGDFDWRAAYTGINVGNVVRIGSDGNLVKADPKNVSDAEAIGIVTEKVNNEYVRVIYVGNANFGGTIQFRNSSGTIIEEPFTKGRVYFLGEGGLLQEIDPSDDNPGWVSKPMFVATGNTSGIVVSYRGFVNDSTFRGVLTYPGLNQPTVSEVDTKIPDFIEFAIDNPQEDDRVKVVWFDILNHSDNRATWTFQYSGGNWTTI